MSLLNPLGIHGPGWRRNYQQPHSPEAKAPQTAFVSTPWAPYQINFTSFWDEQQARAANGGGK